MSAFILLILGISGSAFFVGWLSAGIYFERQKLKFINEQLAKSDELEKRFFELVEEIESLTGAEFEDLKHKKGGIK